MQDYEIYESIYLLTPSSQSKVCMATLHLPLLWVLSLPLHFRLLLVVELVVAEVMEVAPLIVVFVLVVAVVAVAVVGVVLPLLLDY